MIERELTAQYPIKQEQLNKLGWRGTEPIPNWQKIWFWVGGRRRRRRRRVFHVVQQCHEEQNAN